MDYARRIANTSDFKMRIFLIDSSISVSVHRDREIDLERTPVYRYNNRYRLSPRDLRIKMEDGFTIKIDDRAVPSPRAGRSI